MRGNGFTALPVGLGKWGKRGVRGLGWRGESGGAKGEGRGRGRGGREGEGEGEGEWKGEGEGEGERKHGRQ